eukprot:CAMPEP_0172889222 /NCGR_PEP_ID=MMETSP1075-20121228/138292_1 /TAXON_ID=2916 /ORGANISM="Ceratium fusus, Strain PA161109" /LENGTH=72 /DNA_ID=CAMNT_0013743229 /DNA_START=24 /DNA_END=242 /DNA_ORIENTATION=+
MKGMALGSGSSDGKSAKRRRRRKSLPTWPAEVPPELKAWASSPLLQQGSNGMRQKVQLKLPSEWLCKNASHN